MYKRTTADPPGPRWFFAPRWPLPALLHSRGAAGQPDSIAERLLRTALRPKTRYFLLTVVRTAFAVFCSKGVSTSSPSDLALPSRAFCTTGAVCPV